MRCMPWPLAVLCWLDNRKGPHDETAGMACRAHDTAMRCWWKCFPGSERRFNRKWLKAERAA